MLKFMYGQKLYRDSNISYKINFLMRYPLIKIPIEYYRYFLFNLNNGRIK